MRYGFGIDLGGTTVKIACFDECGTMLDAWQIPTRTENGGEGILPDIAAAVKAYLEEKKIDRSRVIGAGLGVPGPVNGQGVVNKCVNLGWGVFNVAETLSGMLGFPVKAGNDANVAALGEYWKGGGAGSGSMVMVTLGTGVGGGIVLDGHLLHGAHGSGGELGHMVQDPSETELCGCGKQGCVEQYCSATGVVTLAKRYLASCSEASALRSTEGLTAKAVFDAAKDGDGVAKQILEQYYDHLGRFLASMCCVVDPDVVVLGGGVCKAGQVLLDGVRPYFNKYVFHAARGVQFALAKLENDAGAYGAFKLALDAFG